MAERYSGDSQPERLAPAPAEAGAAQMRRLVRLERQVSDLADAVDALRIAARQGRQPQTEAGESEQGAEADILARLDSLERDLRRMPASLAQAMRPGEASAVKAEAMRLEAGTGASPAIRERFLNDDNASVDRRMALEDAGDVFAEDSLSALSFDTMDCNQRLCRLQFRDASANPAEASLAENELLLNLSERYGSGVTIYGGERDGNRRSLYIELPES